MANAPRWKVYNTTGEYVAACRYPEDAACLMAFYGDGASIRWQHGKPIWIEGAEDRSASDSYDHVAEVVKRRLAKRFTA